MATRFANGKIKLFEGLVPKNKASLIGINFNKDVPRGDIQKIHSALRKMLELKYGEGVESKSNT